MSRVWKPNTNVVCEGYAKAFQYLAELGTTETTVISVQGYLNRIDAKTAHMWNIVTLRGHNYLADVTHCDAGGYGTDALFMKGSTDGSPADGYSVGSQKYFYLAALPWSEEELTLSRMDYTVWRAAAEKAPEVELSWEQQIGASRPSRLDSYGFRQLKKVLEHYFDRLIFIPAQNRGATDARNYEDLCSCVMRFGPFLEEEDVSREGIHGTNERISVRTYLQGIRVLIRMMETTCFQAAE